MELSKADWLTQATRNIAKDRELARELYQFYFLTLLEKPDEQIEKIYRDGYIQFWSIRLLYLAINGNRHPFGESRIYDQHDVYELDFAEEIDLLDEREQAEGIELERINKINPYQYGVNDPKLKITSMSLSLFVTKLSIVTDESLAIIFIVACCGL